MENIQTKNSFWGKLMKKNKVNSYEIAAKTNIPEEKVKEIISGERTLPTAKVNEFVTAIHETGKENKKGKRNEALIFFADKDVKDLRLRFNYKTQKDLAKAINVSQFTVSRAETNGIGTLNTSTLLKFYNFFKDELNIRVCSAKELKQKNEKTKKDEFKFYKNYFKENNLKELINNKGMSIPEFARSQGLNNSTIYKFIGGKINWSLDLYKKVYNALQEDSNADIPVAYEVPEEVIEIPTIESIEEQKTVEIPTRVNKNSELYTNYEEESSELKHIISSSFNSEALFEYLISNCITKDVVDLYRLLDEYFRG